VLIGFRVSGIGKAFFENGNPADDHNSRATDKSREEQYLDEAHRQNRN